MGQLLLVGNPAKRRKSRKAPSAAQMKARAAFAARARARSITIRQNPVKRRRHHTKVARVHHRRRRNPIGGSALRGIMPMLKNAGMQALGATGVEVAVGFALPYLPASMQSPVSDTGGINPMYYGMKAAAAIGVGMIGRKFLGGRAAQVVEGSLTVTMHDALKQFVQGSGMSITLGANSPGGQVVGPLPASQRLRAYVPGAPGGTTMLQRQPGMHAYVSAGSRESAYR